MKRLVVVLALAAVVALGISSIASAAPTLYAVCHWDNVNQVEDQQYLSQKGVDSHLKNHVGLANHNGDDYSGVCYGFNPRP